MEPDPQTERRVEEAKASLIANAEELGRRFKEAKDKMDIPARIAEHPWIAVGATLAVGALLGLVGGGPRSQVVMRSGVDTEADVKRGLLAMGGAALGTLVVQFAKDFAVRQLVNHASHWMDQRDRMSPNEAPASRMPETESFFRH